MNLFPDIPTAHGFCMYIKKRGNRRSRSIRRRKLFGKGYGGRKMISHIDVLQAGYRHLLCDNTYIYHKGTQSFTQERPIDKTLIYKY